MRTKYSVFAVLLFAFFLQSCEYLLPSLSSDKIDVQEAYGFLKNHKGDEDVVLLDIRSKELFDKGHIEGAVNIDYDQTTFPADVEKLNKEKRYIIIDQKGSKSFATLVLFNELRFDQMHAIIGGYDEWNKQNLPLKF